jgi:lipoprotein-releasing system ATP-binding protein
VAGGLLAVREIVKDYGELRVLDGATFELGAGESVAVTGPSGSGKSTLLNIIGTLDRPTSGQVLVDGRSVHGLDETARARFRNRELGFVFQEHHLLPQCTALENVLLPAVAGRRAGPEEVARAEELLESVGLAERRLHFPAEMSGGERQRVAIARAMMNSPRLLLCDEPTGDLDSDSSEAVAAEIDRLRDWAGCAVVVVTHNERLASSFGRRLSLERGRLTAYAGRAGEAAGGAG